MRTQDVSVIAAADTALLRRQRETLFWVVVAGQAENNQSRPSAGAQSVVSHPTTDTTVAATTPSSIWDCIAVAERGGHDNPAPGPTYWTEYGVVIDVIQDYGTPEEQAAIFNMTADAATRLAPVARFAAKKGFGGWGTLTKQKCGL